MISIQSIQEILINWKKTTDTFYSNKQFIHIFVDQLLVCGCCRLSNLELTEMQNGNGKLKIQALWDQEFMVIRALATGGVVLSVKKYGVVYVCQALKIHGNEACVSL